jgi:hypothetical protein
MMARYAANPLEVGGTSLSLRRAWLSTKVVHAVTFDPSQLNHALRGS